MRFLYTFTVYFYGIGIFVSSYFHKKARLWINGRKNLFKRLSDCINKDDEIVWFHAASLGEFEQGRTVIEAFRKQYPQYKILLTFFSPSGFEIRKNYTSADYIFYLPLDTHGNARRFVEIINPKYAFFIKYEFWFNLLNELKNRKIPTYIISAIFRPQQHFFKPYGTWFRKQLAAFSCFFVQNQTSCNLLRSIGITNVYLTGDTRFDRVSFIAENAQKIPVIENFKDDKPVLLAGSSWKEDEIIIKNCFQKQSGNYKIIFAPHEINAAHISFLKALFPRNSVCYSEINGRDISSYEVLIIDSIGMLSNLYAYASLAFIGGGFGKGIHNILEAAVFGVPVCFGPNYKKFQEAVDLINLKGGFCVENEKMLYLQIKLLLENQDLYRKTSELCKSYVAQKSGATNKIMSILKIDNRISIT